MVKLHTKPRVITLGTLCRDQGAGKLVRELQAVRA